MLKLLKEWWEGRWVPPPDLGPNVFLLGRVERPKLALALEAIGRWLKANYWQAISAAIALGALLVAYKKL